MIQVLIGIALKSLLIAGLTLGLLELITKRSAAERSWVAHIGLFALLIMAFAPLVLPSWNVEAPSMFGDAAEPYAVVQQRPGIGTTVSPTSTVPAAQILTKTAPASPSLSPAAVATALYAVPAAILLFIIFLALARLIALRARADVLVDSHWLSALARAQRRMGFKHGTALLTSDDLTSPVSWGLMRPVILLNSRAVEAAGEAEAIIAHELAHVARMDWVKLLLARIATALFWFNPLVWLLAREAHQLREEAADDSVLAADIVDTDYAQLLVGVARHECPGLLLGAHGVAPSKSSLARRVAKVLDGKSVRRPVARSFALGVFTGAVLIAAPLAALTLTPAGPKAAKPSKMVAASEPQSAYYSGAREVPADLPHIIANGVSTSVSSAVAAATSAAQTSREGAADAVEEAQAAREAALARAQEVREQAHQAAEQAREDARAEDRGDLVSRALAAGRIGVTPEYIAAMRAAAPRLANLDISDFTGMRTLGVTPEYARGLATAGFPSITAEQLMAIWGLETSYGTVTGSTDLLLAIANLGYYGRRRDLFESEFVAALKLIDQGVPRWRLKGSWAGATGYPQFMPSVALRLRADGDGDGYADIWSNELDGLASIATYLRDAGWKPNVAWGIRVRTPATLNRAAIANRTTAPRCPQVYRRHSRWLTMREWRALGVTPTGRSLPDSEMASLIEPDGPYETAYLLTTNYRAILDYNCSNFYAISVGVLADAIARR